MMGQLASFFEPRPLDRAGMIEFIHSRSGNDGNRNSHLRNHRAFMRWMVAVT